MTNDSFSPGQSITGTEGQIAHPDTIAHSSRLERKLYASGSNSWTLVGNGLSNQSFVQGPEGLIVIDTGECVEEMESAMSEIRKVTDAPVVACIYTHFHYVGGTSALNAYADDNIEIYGHSGIEANLKRFGGEIAPRVTRGLVYQFALTLPANGPDGVVNVGLGKFFRNPDHAPFTPGHLPAHHTFNEPANFTIAGLKVEFLPAPSDATDSVTVWFPELKLAINNLLWPALFNIFAIRGEEYRDPRVLLNGLADLRKLGAESLFGAHGPPLEGHDDIAQSIDKYGDSIQFLWDQTVRGANLGLSLDELISFVQLPDSYKDNYLTTQLYGVAEHHVRQIYNGLFGWFDEDESHLFPTPAPERAKKLIAGFGGVAKVRQSIDQALAENDFRWAIEVSSWLVRSELNAKGRTDAGDTEDRARLATGLRGVAQSTTSANVRNWCLTRALELNGITNLERFRIHRFRASDVLAKPGTESVGILRVLLQPDLTEGMNTELCVKFENGSQAGLHVRNHVARATDGSQATLSLELDQKVWAQILGGKQSLSKALESGDAVARPNDKTVSAFFTCFDLEAFRETSS